MIYPGRYVLVLDCALKDFKDSQYHRLCDDNPEQIFGAWIFRISDEKFDYEKRRRIITGFYRSDDKSELIKNVRFPNKK